MTSAGDVTVRIATQFDSAAIDAVVVEAFRDQGPDAASVSRVRSADGSVVPIPAADREAWWVARLEELAGAAHRVESGVVLVAEESGRVVGTASVMPLGDGDFELTRVAVMPGWRRRGVGAALAATAIDVARTRGASVLRWTSDPFQQPAHALYATLGAEESIDEHRRRHYRLYLRVRQPGESSSYQQNS